MKSFNASIVAAALAVGGLFSTFTATVRADAEVNVTTGGTEVGKPLAARAYDVVAYFTDGKATLGLEQFTVVHGDAAYRFASQAHADLFKASPEKYLPQYGGFCAFGAFVGKKFDGDPTLWKIVDGKLYFNLNPTIAGKWSEDTVTKIKTADEKWKAIEHKAPADIK